MNDPATTPEPVPADAELAPRPTARIVRPGKGLAHELVEALKARLESRAIRPGDRLPSESEIVQTYGVSRSVVREALSKLQAAGLVQTLHGVGTFALEPPTTGRPVAALSVDSTSDMLEMLELRASVESDAAGLAAARRSAAHLREMHQALDDFARHVGAVGETVGPDFRLHMAIAQATGNRYYVGLMSQLDASVIPHTRVFSAWLGSERRARHLQTVHQEHQDIVAAIERQDAEAARAAMRIHLVNSRKRQRDAHAEAPPRD